MRAALLAGVCGAAQGLRQPQHADNRTRKTSSTPCLRQRQCPCTLLPLPPPPPPSPAACPACIVHPLRPSCTCFLCCAAIAAAAQPALRPQQLQGIPRRRAAVRASAAAPGLDSILSGLLELPPQELEKAVEDAFQVSLDGVLRPILSRDR